MATMIALTGYFVRRKSPKLNEIVVLLLVGMFADIVVTLLPLTIIVFGSVS